MNQRTKTLSTLFMSLLALAALLLVGVAGSTAETPSETPKPAEEPTEPPKPTEEECQPGQPCNRRCPTIVTFHFPKRSFLEDGKVKLVHLGCNKSCNQVFFAVKHGKRLVARDTAWPKGNYLPDIYAHVNRYAKKQLRRHRKLVVNARVCVHPPGPETFCKHRKIILRKR